MILLLWIPIIALIIWGIRLNKKDDDEGIGQLTIGGAFFVVFLLVCIIEPISNGANAARYTNFYDNNSQNYAIAVEETTTLLSIEEFENQLIAGSVEKWEQAGYVSERIMEWRDNVNKFNSDIAVYRYYSDHPLIGILFPKLPNNVHSLRIGK